MTDVIVVAISAAVGIATLIFSRLRCRFVTTTNEHGDSTQISACGFTDKPLVADKDNLVETYTPSPGSILVLKKQ
jgi:hypothetical protein